MAGQVLSQGQIRAYAQAAGLTPAAAQIASAIAMAESRGDVAAHNPVPPDDSYGLWQINMLGKLGPSRRAQFGLSSNAQLYDPAVNARAMKAISSNGRSWIPWSTYTNGAYRKFMGNTAPGQVLTPEELAAQGGTADPVGTGSAMGDLGYAMGQGARGIVSMAELMLGAAEWMSQTRNWIRLAQVILGGNLVILGLLVSTRGTWQPAVKTVASVAGVATPKTAIRKVTTAAKGT